MAGGSGKLATVGRRGVGSGAASPKLVTVVRRDSQVTRYYCRPHCWAPARDARTPGRENKGILQKSLFFCLDLCLDLANRDLSRQTLPASPLRGQAVPDSYKKKCSWKAGSLQSRMTCVVWQQSWLSSGIKEILSRESKSIR